MPFTDVNVALRPLAQQASLAEKAEVRYCVDFPE